MQKKPLKILMVAPLKREVSQDITAARNKFVFDLSKKLKEKGHNVSILGTGDSYIKGVKVIPVIKKAFNKVEKEFENPFYAHTAYLAKQAKMLSEIAGDFDVVHNHAYPEFLPLLCYDFSKTPILTTIHSQLTKETDDALSLFKKGFFVAISKSAKKLAKKTEIFQVVYNGIDTSLFKFNKKKKDYLLWIGRLSQAKNKKGNFMDPKGIRWAIKLAEETNEKLLLSGNVEDIQFFKQEVRPHLSNKIKWVGKISKEQPLTKKEVSNLMSKAKVFLMTINWNEPFGLVMAEAQSCGTPVIAFRRGSAPELIINNKTGFLVDPKDKVKGLQRALGAINTINPIDCRENAEKNFSLDKMVSKYEETYYQILK